MTNTRKTSTYCVRYFLKKWDNDAKKMQRVEIKHNFRVPINSNERQIEKLAFKCFCKKHGKCNVYKTQTGNYMFGSDLSNGGHLSFSVEGQYWIFPVHI